MAAESMRRTDAIARARADERAKTLAEAKARVERLKQNDPGEFYVGYDEAIGDALTAIDGEAGDE